MKRNKFSLSNYKLLTMDMGKLIPVNWMEVLPGDTVQQSTSALVRVAPLVSPVMHPVRVRLHHWFVPNRLIWDTFEDFITGGPDGTDSTEPPNMELSTVTEGTLHDYFGIPTGSYSPDLPVSALPFRAYNLIFNHWYRDQDLVNELTIDESDGVDTTTSTSIQNVAWEKDYFTTARPWMQKGSGVTIPLGSTAPLTPSGNMRFKTAATTGIALMGSGVDNLVDANKLVSAAALGFESVGAVADLSAATGIDISDLRLALAIQRYQEARAKYGSRYVEYLRSLGVRSSDGRLSLPEYLGGGRQTIQFSEVLQTAEGTDPVGTMKGHGIAAMRTNRYRRYFEEHGIVMTLMSVIPKSIYSSALHRGWSRTVKEDYYQRELAQIGEQEIPNKEIQADHTSPDDVFGYQARYNEYRSMPSTIHGEFRSTFDHWHYARIFGSDVSLNQSFTDCVPTDRVYATSLTHPLLVMANHSIQARRQIQPVATTKTF